MLKNVLHIIMVAMATYFPHQNFCEKRFFFKSSPFFFYYYF